MEKSDLDFLSGYSQWQRWVKKLRGVPASRHCQDSAELLVRSHNTVFPAYALFLFRPKIAKIAKNYNMYIFCMFIHARWNCHYMKAWLLQFVIINIDKKNTTFCRKPCWVEPLNVLLLCNNYKNCIHKPKIRYIQKSRHTVICMIWNFQISN